MVDDNNSFENKVKIAFSKVKEDISQIKSEIESLKTSLIELKREIKRGTSISTGNDRVLQQTYNKLTTVNKHQKALKEAVKDLNNYFEEIFRSLTDKEFTIFFTIYQLEEEMKKGVTYDDIATKLKSSQSFIRGCTSEMILKGAPIEKTKINNKVLLFIKKDFRSLNLAEKIMNFRQTNNKQTTLLEI